MQTIDFDAVNTSLRFSMISVYTIQPGVLGADRASAIERTQTFFDSLAEKEVVHRGLYDITGTRADADFMIWNHSLSAEDLQAAYNDFRKTPLGQASIPFWSSLTIHRPAEFNKKHIPAFLADIPTKKYLCVYPFVRSFEWYLLPEEERAKMLRDHGQAAAGFRDVLANTMTAFALGDYEWVLAFEADELHRLVDLLRELRATEARRHVQLDVPFFTGPSIEVTDLINALP